VSSDDNPQRIEPTSPPASSTSANPIPSLATIGIPGETYPGEHRVAATPSTLGALAKAGFEVLVEAGAGVAAGFPDEAYVQKGASIAASRAEVFSADVILQVRTFGANPVEGRADLDLFHPDQVVIGLADPLTAGEACLELAERKVTVFALELLPRITRAQSMDVLSSQATIAGYKAVVMAAGELPKMFPLLTTAAGTMAPARVLVIGAGVAGLQAIATARRLGAVVEAYDVRPAVKEEVESLGARFVELPLNPGDAQDASGYAKALGESFYQRQRELLTKVVGASDAVITTALIPGKPAPILVTAEMVAGMASGSVVVDLAAERGGNCELTRPDEVVETAGVKIFGPTNLPATVPHHASQMYAKNISTFLLHVVKDGKLLDPAGDEIAGKTLVAAAGQLVNPRVLEALAGPAEGTPAEPAPMVPAGPASETPEPREGKVA
jgi:NAD(P) transhydrogenase subunit alpha